jgi:serine protease Do
MKKVFVLLLLVSLGACSGHKQFYVSKILSNQSVQLEDGTVVILIGVTTPTKSYIEALKKIENNYIQLYDEDYDPINELNNENIKAYVYDLDGNCINNLVDEGEATAENHQQIQTGNDETDTKDRISGSVIKSLPHANLSEMYEKNKYAVFLIAVPLSESTYAQGTGFFIDSKGTGVSNYHVFAEGNANDAIIKTIDNHQYNIKQVLIYDDKLDYIVFEVQNEHHDFPYLPIATERVGVGEDVFAIGNPKGLEHTLSKGIISSYRDNDMMIQTTTEITHGSSGGPLFNMKGEVIGITTSGIGEANLNFAMNIQKLSIK